MATRFSQQTLGFSTAATTIRPPVGEVWLFRGAIEVGAAPTIRLTNGTIGEDYRTSDADTQRAIALTNGWYLSCVAATATTGWVATLENVTHLQEGATGL